MYRYQFDRLFKKLGLLIAAIIVITVLSKIFVTKYNYPITTLTKEQLEIFDTLCESTTELTPDEKIAYIEDWRSEYREEYDKTATPTAAQKTAYENNQAAYEAYREQLIGCIYNIMGLKEYIRTGEGFREMIYPTDLAENPQVYSKINRPESVNGYYFLCFLKLQNMDLIPVFVLLLVGVFVADGYEKRIDLQIKISAQSRVFCRSRELLLTFFIVALNLINLVSDMMISGMITHLSYLSAPIQSVDSFVFFPVNMTIFQAVLYIFFMELCGSLVCYNIFMLLAKQLRSVKLYLICTAAFVAVFTVISKFFHKLTPFCFTGINNKQSVLGSIKYYSAIDSTLLYPAAFVLVIVLIELCTWRYTGYYESKKSKNK